ncbi:hypothetical protein L2E82_23078 [Cichorium intybus]|uniref:Uncharacterized protein n=1 Tax=Cichorium intybus TaxID=13427 RepID=A0ACB9DZR3_CICIN|nr:hypothetical protein L2E82_23078 [Cichorium intybus]
MLSFVTKVTPILVALSSGAQNQKLEAAMGKPLKDHAFATPDKVAEIVQNVNAGGVWECGLELLAAALFSTFPQSIITITFSVSILSVDLRLSPTKWYQRVVRIPDEEDDDAGHEKHKTQTVDDDCVCMDDVIVCDICGDVGREDRLAICSRCKDGAEHTYCMKSMINEVPRGDWQCEECKSSEELNCPNYHKKGSTGPVTEMVRKWTKSLMSSMKGSVGYQKHPKRKFKQKRNQKNLQRNNR